MTDTPETPRPDASSRRARREAEVEAEAGRRRRGGRRDGRRGAAPAPRAGAASGAVAAARTAAPARAAHGARHGRLRRGHAVGVVGRVTAAALAVVLVSGASVGAIAAYQVRQDIGDGVDLQAAQGQTQQAQPPSLSAYDGGFNVLLVGTDNDTAQDEGAFGQRDATLNDVNILLHVSADHTNATAVSIPRDMVVPIPACAKEDGSGYYSAMSARPINEAWSYGGLGCVASTVSELTGLDVPFAGMISFNGVIEMSNAVGGVPVCAAEPIKDHWTGLDIPAGESVLQGTEALAFLRTRHGVGDGSDLGRIGSQQVYLSSLLRTIKSADTLGNPTKLYSLARAAASNMQLSSSLTSIDTMVQIGLALRDLPLEDVTFVQYPGSTGGSGVYQGKVQPDTRVAEQLFDAIRADRPFTLPEDSTGLGSTLAPTEGAGTGDADAAAPTSQAPAADATAEPTAPATGGTDAAADSGAGTDSDAETAPEVIDGLEGQTAAQQTCSRAFGR